LLEGAKQVVKNKLQKKMNIVHYNKNTTDAIVKPLSEKTFGKSKAL